MSQSQEVQLGVSDARANLTEVIARVRLRAEHIVLTRREKPQAVLVSHGFYTRALAALGETPERVPYEEQQAG
ncbi:type II toxin-antitoxin system prevent-host-death family antitoxin [Streptomyces sp. NPDC021019]|uniref:type II toxin-antitoxin system prevent-host-death family antitoxin n=1 Tax=Streptomyces sp. NPDC021019 TaxID=3365108 RepID=UPI0037AC9579